MSELDRELEALRREEVGDSFPAVSAWLHRVEAERARAPLAAGRRRGRLLPAARLATAMGALVLLAVACALPVRRTETLGWYASVRLPGTAAQAQAGVARFPWARGALTIASAGSDGGTTLYLASMRADPAEARRWARDLAALPGASGAATAPLRDQVVRPAYAAAGRALFGTRFPGAGMGERERMGRLIALARELAPGSVVVLEHPRAGVPGEAVVYPRGADSAGPVEVALPDEPQVSLMVLRGRPGAEPDTIMIPLDAGLMRGAGDAERTEMVRRALRERGVDNVEVRVENGIVRVTAVPKP
jgi:hypothetical protein